jgi:hypothetical protein
MIVAEVRQNGRDAASVEIKEVYTKHPPEYAIYRTEERVMVHFADDDEQARQQSAILTPLNPIRGEIYGLLDGWRLSKAGRHKSTADGYFRRIADAIGIALQNDPASSLTVLTGIKTDIVEERTARARFEYLITALSVSILVILLAWGIIGLYKPTSPAWDLWFALAGGTLGAFFSIAIAIRSRTVLTDLQWRANTVDAVLRVIIGAIAAGVLVSLVQLQAVKFTIGEVTPNPGENPWLYILIVAFVAGFSERLVPDLLEKSRVDSSTSPLPVQAAVPKQPPSSSSTARQASNAVQDQKAAEDEYRVEDCLCSTPVREEEATSDAELPVATGGIASPRTGTAST